MLRAAASTAFLLAAVASTATDFTPVTTVRECMTATQPKPLPEDTRHVLSGSTSPDLHADAVDNYQMYWVERQPACIVRIALQKNAQRLAAIVTREALPFQVNAHTHPGRDTEADAEDLEKYGAVLVENVVIESENERISCEMSFSGLRVDNPYRQHIGYVPSALRIPSVRVQLTGKYKLVDRANDTIGVTFPEIAVRMSIHEPPHFLGHRDTFLGPVYVTLEHMMEMQFNQTLENIDQTTMNGIAYALRGSFNEAIKGTDISGMQPRRVLQLIEVSKAAEKRRRKQKQRRRQRKRV